MVAERTTPGKASERPPMRAWTIDQASCINCWWCRRDCPTGTIHFFDRPERKHWIDPTGCIDCGICAAVCPMHIISRDESYVHEDAGVLEAAKETARTWARSKRALRARRRHAKADDNPMVTFLQRLQEADINPADLPA